ncbi:MAG TPA: winged helix-turn-helix domain-containing protein [Vicinamibacterales bacterium]|nr:winged helix-turn-helix domain-containing protein [Vicinamibacterales bacterium]
MDEHLRFDCFQLDVTTGELRKSGALVRLPPQPAKILILLARNAGRLVTREDIRNEIWRAGTFVDFEQGLNHCIKLIRAALGDDARAPRFIETLQRRGYRFLVPIDRAEGPIASSEKVVLAVVPFENLSGDPEQEYFSDGLTDEMITQLGRLNPQRLGVIARTSAMRYKATRKTVAEIGNELGVSYVMEGSVRRTEGQVRVAARLIHARDQTQLWAATYDRDISDILRLQSELARIIADRIEVNLAPDARHRLDRAQAVDRAAYVEYLKGRFFWNKRTKASLAQAISHFERAAAADASVALAHCGVGDCHVVLGSQLWVKPKETAARANAALERALEIDPTLAEAHAALGFIRSLYEYRWSDADAEFRRAIELNENYATAHHWLSFHLAAVGRLDQAIEEILKADVIDPLSPIISTNVGTVFFWARQFDRAIERYLEILSREPSFWIAHWMLGLAYEQRGEYRAAAAAHRMAIAVSDGVSPVLPASLARTLALAGDRAGAEQLLAGLRTEGIVSFFHIAAAQTALGDLDAAVRSLHEGRAQGESWIAFVRTDARFDPLHGDPQYEDLVRLMGLQGR